MKREIVAKEKERIDKYLKKYLPFSREKIQKLIKNGFIVVNGEKIEPSYKLKIGDKIEISDDKIESASSIPPENLPLEIIYEDEDIIVINKPPGIITHPTPQSLKGTLLNRILAHTTLSQIGAPLRPGVVHRLDKETSGVIVFAKSDYAYWNLVEQFKNRNVEKTYLAFVKGKFLPQEKVVEFTVVHDKENPTKMKVRFLRGKKAITRIKVLKYCGNFSLLEVKPLTGRTHQIRITLKYLGFPILGDTKYGVESELIKRTALHSYKLSLHHPRENKKMEFTAPLPDDLKVLLRECLSFEK